jgi:hypothetical protein
VEKILPLNGKEFLESGILLHIFGGLDYVRFDKLLYLKQNKGKYYFGIYFAC